MKWCHKEDEMRTHQAECVSERRLQPLRQELHSTTMSQGLPSVDTHTAKSSVHVRARVHLPVVLIDRHIDTYNTIREMER